MANQSVTQDAAACSRNADHNLATSDHQTAGKSAGLEAYIVTDLSSFRESTRWENLHPSDVSSIFFEGSLGSASQDHLAI